MANANVNTASRDELIEAGVRARTRERDRQAAAQG